MPPLLSAVEVASKQAASLPFKMNDAGRGRYGYANTLIESATSSTDRASVSPADFDYHDVVSPAGRRLLLGLGRTMFWRIPQLMAAVLEQSDLAASPFTPLFLGKNKEWGKQASEWLNNWHQVMCVEGWPYDYDTYTTHLISSAIVDGMICTHLTEDASGNPRVQLIRAHRLGSGRIDEPAKVAYSGRTLSIDGAIVDASLPWESNLQFTAQIVDGVIVDGLNRPIAYRIYDSKKFSSTYRDLSARSCFPCFFPFTPDQLTQVSLLGSSVFDWQDVREFRSFD